MTDQPSLFLHNSFSGHKEKFVPQNPNRVTLYVCGPTVYSYAHIGNARAAVAFDQLYRVLRELYGKDHVLYARNFTDIDDKIIAAAKESGEDISAITDKFTKIYQQDMGALGVLAPDLEPAATEHIQHMQDLISRLMTKGHAYAGEGHILFDISTYADYGRLSKISQDEMIAGARVEIAPYKKNAADFVLWKPSKEDEPGWDAPEDWGIKGRGRPGWHLECSAMIEAAFDGPIDIHGGGQDLRFPHHENEIAQSCCAGDLGDVPLARYWLHNGFLTMGDDKMSKSLGNIVLPHDLLNDWDGEVIRWALLSAQYRQPLVWTQSLLQQSKKQLDRFYRVLQDLADVTAANMPMPSSVLAPLCDDLNSPEAMAAMHALRDGVAKATDRAAAKGALLAAGAILGVLQQDPEQWFRGKAAGGLSDSEIEALLAERIAAKSAKNYARADEIRDILAAQGIMIEDSKTGTKWRRG